MPVMNMAEFIQKAKDYTYPKGLTSKPLSGDDEHYIPITPQHINLTKWILRIIYHMYVNVLNLCLPAPRIHDAIYFISFQISE
ncbi:unnamed protein product [Didymodactylos carnosus]|uniref:Uncharacterized protein n=1 Tax=Didymodactylos carnosus TaxID=1234261 RepID=A0A815I592_9BILA|nr:unnamed protein product [Didymodactylos carnosus]CAF4236185.1 unnamed protein product [Didymodactylos carnosus]